MKKIVLFISVLLCIFAFSACSDNGQTEVPVVTPNSVDEDVESLFDITTEEAVACYYSLLTEDGFGNYVLGFPPEWRKGYQDLLGYNDEEFEEAMNNATYTLHVNRDFDYQGAEYKIEYELVGEREVEGDEYDRIMKDLTAYCFMSKGSVEKMIKQTYSVHTYGYFEDTNEVVNENTAEEEICLLYIKGEGWYISPTNFQLP